MGCGASKSAEVSNEKKEEKEEKKEDVCSETPPTCDEAAKDDSVVKNHPPKPPQRLEEQPQTILRAADLTSHELLPSINTPGECGESEAQEGDETPKAESA